MLFEKHFADSHKPIVVLTNPKTYMNYKYAKKEIKDQIIRADQLIAYIKRQDAESAAHVQKEKNVVSQSVSAMPVLVKETPSSNEDREELVRK